MIDTRFVARHARRFRLVATGAVTLVGDIRRHLRNESHRTRPASQRVMRQAHVLTHGRSHQLLAYRPGGPSLDPGDRRAVA